MLFADTTLSAIAVRVTPPDFLQRTNRRAHALAAVLRSALSAGALRSARGGPRQARRDERARVLPPEHPGAAELAELTKLVDAAEARDPDLARRVDLEGLLDRHVALAIARARARRIITGAERSRLASCERRLRCLARCETRAAWLDDELARLAEAIRMIARVGACPVRLAAGDAIERALQIAELDDADAARQLLAELPAQ